ncbi:hypothetical protein [Vibrio coralliilyticus]|uniref:hypothetical protein n=1 Tax=Vibrio coralliilyticus TaxID=190893 RepID=UPI0015605F86|nr:hypothetical protein [Vibrio coralliilyticus]NRF33153.1 hypothetical protein [Vibrio coralliilyticus]NRF55672.1 hypothetical protein [Vibrio coralliilyticus]
MNFKEVLPTALLPLAREVKFRLTANDDEKLLKEEVEDLQAQWAKIIQNSSDTIANNESAIQKEHILFVTGYGVGTHFLTLEPIVSMALYERNCKVTSLYCNKSLPACEFNPVGNNAPESINALKPGITDSSICFKCNKCKSNLKTMSDILPIDAIGYDKYLTDSDYQKALEISRSIKFEELRDFTFDGVKVGEEAFASILRVTFKGEVQDTEINRYLAKRYILSGVLTSIAYEKAYQALNPDRIVCIHGIYQIHGLAVKVAQKLDIPVVVLGGGGIRKDTVVVCHDETYHHQLVNEDNAVWEQFDITEEEKSKTYDYAVKKRSNGGSADYLSYHPNPIEDADSLYSTCNIDRERKIISLYTNVIWDAQILYEGNAFKDIFDWIETSINELGKNENIWVVIRIHPAEAKGGNPTLQPMLAEINKRFKRLPDNVRIIPPESDISSYTLAQESHVNIIYGTKMGLEIALMKKSLVVCGETFSRNKGYGLDITSKTQYLNLCNKIHNYSPDLDVTSYKAMQYAHYFYFRKMIDLPIITKNPGNKGVKSGKKLTINTLSDLRNDQGIQVICDGILDLKPFYIGAK